MAKKAAKPGRPRKAAAEATETKQAKSSEVRRAISAQKLKALMASKRSAMEDIDAIAGGLGSEIKTAVDKHYLNRKIFVFCCSLDRMENEKIAGHLDDLYHYLDISGLQARADKVQRMEFGGEGADDGEAGEEADDENVHQFPAAAE